MVRSFLLLFVVMAPLLPGQDGTGFESLFDGKSTAGWVHPFDWGKVAVEDGEIRLRGDRKFWLVTEQTFADFELELELFVPDGGNSGVQFRSHFEKNRLWGYQAEVDTGERRWSGGLYDEGRRGWLHPLKDDGAAQAAYHHGAWNRYRILCEGDRIRIEVNGVLTTDYRDAMDLEGHVALQHHGEKGMIYRFRSIRLRGLGAHVWRSLFDGQSLEGWHASGGGGWDVKDGVLGGAIGHQEPRHGLLWSDRSFEDATVRLRFRVLEGDSGLYLRARPAETASGAAGLQVEMDDGAETGGIYETGGRGWLVKPQGEAAKAYHPGAWTTLVAAMHGRQVTVDLEGRRTAAVGLDARPEAGPLAVQLHGGRDVRIEISAIDLLAPAE